MSDRLPQREVSLGRLGIAMARQALHAADDEEPSEPITDADITSTFGPAWMEPDPDFVERVTDRVLAMERERADLR